MVNLLNLRYQAPEQRSRRLLELFQAETSTARGLRAMLPLTLHPGPMQFKRRRFLRTLACSEMACEGGNLLAVILL
jgi:hypothetical protein